MHDYTVLQYIRYSDLIDYSVMEMFIHHEGRYMKYNARKRDAKQTYTQKANTNKSLYTYYNTTPPCWRST